MSQTTLKQIAQLNRMTPAQLQDRWRQLMGNEPPRYSREFLVKRLAYRLQELAYGGLALSAREKMNQLLEEAGCDVIGALKPGGDSQRTRNQPIIGTRMIREWNGQHQEVTVVQGGYEFRGRRYRSLSAIAKLITGTHWNGPAFFGLRQAGKRAAI